MSSGAPGASGAIGSPAVPAGAGRGNSGGGGDPLFPGGDDSVRLHEAAQAKYLNYALSVITARALPDVRDGLKPVQRRILFTMWQNGITFDAKHRKCAAVVGDVMGRYHPHGDSAIYEALVRMAQSFSLRYPLIDGSGNFGSMDGDAAAAMRYTECRLQRLSDQVLQELEQNTVAFRPNYDGTREEPVVLPARIPNLLINGATGIAVGMATNIPPHNLAEVCQALVKLAENPDLTTRQLCRWVKGPDFPTGGQIISSPDDLKQLYETGQGSVKVRATFEAGPVGRTTKTLYITSIPYTVNKSTLVERIADVVLSRKLPHLTDVRDLSTDDVRIELELKKDADEQMVMAYLFNHTPLQTNFAANLTCLVPTENPLLGRPERLDLKSILWHFLHFRLDVVTKRLEHELAQLLKRIHILEGFEIVFDALDEIIRIIRKSEGKADAAQKIMARFQPPKGLDAEQTDAILELKLYRLARLEVLVIQQELDEKRKRVAAINKLLKNDDARWAIVRTELDEISAMLGKTDKRRTIIESIEDEPEYSAEDFIIDEDNVVIVTRDGWVKRQKEIKDLSTTRLREGDSVLGVMPGSTKATLVFFSSLGVAYTSRFIDIPASTGYGDPIQKLFKLRDGEKIIAAYSLDPRVAVNIKPPEGKPDAEPRTHAVAVTTDGYALRFSLEPFIEPSTRSGRRYAKLPEGQQVVGVELLRSQKETLIAASYQAHAMLCKADEVNFLSGPGRGVILIKLDDKDDRVIGFRTAIGDRDLLRVETSMGGEQTISLGKYDPVSRGGKGREIIKRGQLVKIVPEELTPPAMLESDDSQR